MGQMERTTRESVTQSIFEWTDRITSTGATVALVGGVIEKGATFTYRHTFNPIAGQIATHRMLRWAAPIGMAAMGYNALRSTQRLLTGTSEDRWADGLMIGGAVCGVASLVTRFNPMLRAWVALAGIAFDSIDLAHIGWIWREGEVSTGDLLLQAGLTIVFGFDRETRQAVRSIRWRLDTTLFLHPILGEHFPQILQNPDSVAINVPIPITVQEKIARLSESLTITFEEKWAQAAPPLSAKELAAIFSSFRARLAAVVRLGVTDLPDVLTEYRMTIDCSNAPNFFPRHGNPIELAVNHFNGILMNYARWGTASFHPHTFFARALEKNCLLQSYHRPLDAGEGFFLRICPGIAHGFGGIEYRLMWQGKHSGLTTPISLMSIGYIRRPHGYAIVKIQGAPQLGKKKAILEEGGRPKSLMRHARKIFGEDLGEWLTRQVLRQLQREDPSSNLYFRKGIRQMNLFARVEEPNSPTQVGSFHTKAGLLSETELTRLLDQAIRKFSDRLQRLQEVQREGVDGLEKKLKRATHARKRIFQLNQMAQNLGFVAELPDSSWAVLEPDSRGWKVLQERRPTDIP